MKPMKARGKKNLVIKFEPDGLKSEFSKGIRILDALKETGLHIRSECDGHGICGKCKILVQESSMFSNITDVERKLLSSSALKSGYRLACQCSVFDDTTVYIPEESRMWFPRLITDWNGKLPKPDPSILKVFMKIPEPTLFDSRSDFRRIQDNLEKTCGLEVTDIDNHLLKKLPIILRESNWKVTAAIQDEKEIISIEKGDTSDKAYGVAIDIGTSRVACYLVDLHNGKPFAVESMENPQVVYGEDVISRISYASETEESLRKLRKLVINCLNSILCEACRENSVNPKHFYELTVVGNTAMHHIFLGLQPKNLGLSPHTPVVSAPINEKARDLSLDVLPTANVHILPVIGGFVGGDTVADII